MTTVLVVVLVLTVVAVMLAVALAILQPFILIRAGMRDPGRERYVRRVLPQSVSLSRAALKAATVIVAGVVLTALGAKVGGPSLVNMLSALVP